MRKILKEMLKMLLNPREAEKHYFQMFVIGFFYASLSIILGVWIFREHSSIAIVFLTVLSCIYVVQKAIGIEEKVERNYNSEKWMIRHHWKLFVLMLFLFLGFLVAFSMFSFILPEDTADMVFNIQKISLEAIKPITGNAIDDSGILGKIISNNLNVVLVSLIFALFYGAGAIYILVWNASMMGLVIGNIAKESYGLAAFPAAFFKFLLHGIPEMMAYVIASIAGGILYFALIKGDLIKKGRSRRIIGDIIMLLGIAVMLILVSGLIEIFISARL